MPAVVRDSLDAQLSSPHVEQALVEEEQLAHPVLTVLEACAAGQACTCGLYMYVCCTPGLSSTSRWVFQQVG
jgi:hypothetical protein